MRTNPRPGVWSTGCGRTWACRVSSPRRSPPPDTSNRPPPSSPRKWWRIRPPRVRIPSPTWNRYASTKRLDTPRSTCTRSVPTRRASSSSSKRRSYRSSANPALRKDQGDLDPGRRVRVHPCARRLSSSSCILARTSIVFASELPHDPKYQPPLLLGQARNLAGCLLNCPVSQSLHKLPVEQRLPSIQEV